MDRGVGVQNKNGRRWRGLDAGGRDKRRQGDVCAGGEQGCLFPKVLVERREHWWLGQWTRHESFQKSYAPKKSCVCVHNKERKEYIVCVCVRKERKNIFSFQTQTLCVYISKEKINCVHVHKEISKGKKQKIFSFQMYFSFLTFM